MDWPLRVQVAVAPSNHHNFGLAAATSHTLEHLHTWAVAEALRNRTGVVAVGRRVIRRRVVAADILHRTARIHLHTLVAGAGRKGLVRSPLLLHKQARLWSRREVLKMEEMGKGIGKIVEDVTPIKAKPGSIQLERDNMRQALDWKHKEKTNITRQQHPNLRAPPA